MFSFSIGSEIHQASVTAALAVRPPTLLPQTLDHPDAVATATVAHRPVRPFVLKFAPSSFQPSMRRAEVRSGAAVAPIASGYGTVINAGAAPAVPAATDPTGATPPLTFAPSHIAKPGSRYPVMTRQDKNHLLHIVPLTAHWPVANVVTLIRQHHLPLSRFSNAALLQNIHRMRKEPEVGGAPLRPEGFPDDATFAPVPYTRLSSRQLSLMRSIVEAHASITFLDFRARSLQGFPNLTEAQLTHYYYNEHKFIDKASHQVQLMKRVNGTLVPAPTRVTAAQKQTAAAPAATAAEQTVKASTGTQTSGHGPDAEIVERSPVRTHSVEPLPPPLTWASVKPAAVTTRPIALALALSPAQEDRPADMSVDVPYV